MAMDKTDRRGRWLIVGEHNLNFAVQHRLGDLIGQDARDAEAGGRTVDRRFRGVDGEAGAHLHGVLALRLRVGKIQRSEDESGSNITAVSLLRSSGLLGTP